MPFYNNSAFNGVYKPTLKQATQTLPIYLFGTKDPDQTPFEFSISQVSLTTNVATITVQLVKGGGGSGLLGPSPLPQIGAKMGVQGTTAASGAFNVDPATVTGVSLNANGAGTITFALTHADVGATADSGKLIVQPYEKPDVLTGVSASIPLALSFTPDEADNSRCIFVETAWPSLPTSATVQLQVANVDDDSRYQTVNNVYGTLTTGSPVTGSAAAATVASGAVTQSGAMYEFIMAKFIRLKVTAITGGTLPSIVGTVFV